MTRLHAVSVAITVLAFTGAVVVNNGAPLSPAAVARSTTLAADNAAAAADNTRGAALRTQALASIARSVASQLETSHRLLKTQLGIEASSRHSTHESKILERDILAIQREL